MTARAVVLWLAVVLIAVFVYRGFLSPPPNPPPPPPSPAPESPAVPRVSNAEPVPGPAPSSAPRAEREQAVSALLRGERAAQLLPELATDDGGAVDPSLRDQLAPRPSASPQAPPP